MDYQARARILFSNDEPLDETHCSEVNHNLKIHYLTGTKSVQCEELPFTTQPFEILTYVEEETSRGPRFQSKFVSPGPWQLCSPNETAILEYRRCPIGIEEHKPGMMFATFYGYVSLMIDEFIRVDITVDGAVRVINNELGAKLAVTPNGNITGIISPVGSLYQYGDIIETIIYENDEHYNRLVKIRPDGISFASNNTAVVYRVDHGGARTAIDTFCDLDYDFTKSIFLTQSKYGTEQVTPCLRILNTTKYTMTANGDEKWLLVNGIKIEKKDNDVVRVFKNDGKIELKTSVKGVSAITTPLLRCTTSCNTQNEAGKHFFARREDQRFHYNGRILSIRNGGQFSTFDENNTICLDPISE